MRVSNETKVGALTVIAVTLIIFGFNFLKGRTFFKSGTFIYAKYTDTKGLIVSNPVFVNGFQVGTVFEIENTNENLSEFWKPFTKTGLDTINPFVSVYFA